MQELVLQVYSIAIIADKGLLYVPPQQITNMHHVHHLQVAQHHLLHQLPQNLVQTQHLQLRVVESPVLAGQLDEPQRVVPQVVCEEVGLQADVVGCGVRVRPLGAGVVVRLVGKR